MTYAITLGGKSWGLIHYDHHDPQCEPWHRCLLCRKHIARSVRHFRCRDWFGSRKSAYAHQVCALRAISDPTLLNDVLT